MRIITFAARIMSTPTLWKITCMEQNFPGLWQLWFKHQCVTDGHSPEKGYHLEGKTKGDHDWKAARNALQKIQPDDLIVVALPWCRIGRIGKVLSKKVTDEDWDPLVPGDSDWKEGYMGRRIFVHWELEDAPDSPDVVAQLPEGVNLGRGTMTGIHHHLVEWFRVVIADQANWVGMVGRFGYERALSDYVALYPHRLKDGLEPYPNEKIREKVFADASRADVLLLDRDGKPVIVECKRESPDEGAVRQVRRYIKRLKELTGEQANGILVHGGARAVDGKVWREAEKPPRVAIFQYKLDVEFTPSCRVACR
jgi:hypothetical protein